MHPAYQGMSLVQSAVAAAAPIAASVNHEQQVVNGQSVVNTVQQDPYANFDTPAYMRNKKPVSDARRADMNLLNIPAFLRRQAD